MLFHSPHSSPHCNVNFTSFSSHDNFLICSSSESNKYSRFQLIAKTLSRLYTPLLLQQHFPLSNFCNVEQSLSKYFISLSKFSSSDIYNCIESQLRIRQTHFVWGRLTHSFRPIIQKYYSLNKLGKKFKVASWYRKLTASLHTINFSFCNDYCSAICQSPSKKIMLPTKESILKLVTKNYSLCIIYL